MLKRSMAGLAVVVLGLVLAGCGAQKGETMLQWGRWSDVPSLNTVTDSGMYCLYNSGSLDPRIRVRLEAGDKYGFMKKEDGKVYGFAKNKEGESAQVLDSTMATGYLWKLERK